MCCRLQKLLFLYLLNLQHTLIKIPFFVARNQPHHTIYHESDPIACSLADFSVHWRHIYACTVSICTTSKISAWRQGNTVTNCNNSRPMEPCGFMILDVTLRFVFVFFWFTRTEADNWDMDFKNRMLRPFIWCVQRDYTLFMPYGVNLFFKRHGAILKNAALR